ncbi:MAG TPA: hypothetical protein VLT36_20920, partial [Candidatus Dormibacteraeota bacterium]|nr:hypothetical protein [Candidatus Dormibacteraeota bacterium]
MPPSAGGGDSWMPLLSSDGRFVLFASTANNLAAISSNNPSPVLLPPKENVFLRDRVNGTTTLVSVNAKRTGGGNGDSWPAALSVDGHYALFESIASDLVPNDTNRCSDVFLRDLLSQTTWLVSISTNSGAANGTSGNATMTPDARFIAFVSAANDLVAADTNGISDLFVRDMQLGSTVLASPGAVSTNHTAPSGGSDSPIITPDGRYVAFYSTATNLVPGVRSTGEVYIRDLMLGVTTWASGYVRSTLQTARHWTNPISYGHVLSTNGDFIAFEASTNPPSAGVVLRYSLQTALT